MPYVSTNGIRLAYERVANLVADTAGLIEALAADEQWHPAASGQDAIDLDTDRRDTMRAVQVPCRVVGSSDDLICPPRLCAELAEVIPD